MKKMYVFLTLSVCLLFSCNNDTKEPEKEIENLEFYYESVTLQVPNKTARGGKTETLPVDITVTYDNSVDEVVDVTLNTEAYTRLGITHEEFYNSLKNIMEGKTTNLQGRPAVYAETDLPPDSSPHTKCIEWCKQHYTNEDGSKKKGRGACKANCWVDTAMRFLDKIADLIPKFD